MHVDIYLWMNAIPQLLSSHKVLWSRKKIQQIIPTEGFQNPFINLGSFKITRNIISLLRMVGDVKDSNARLSTGVG